MVSASPPPTTSRRAGASDRDEDLAELLAEVRRVDVQCRRLVTGLLAGGYTSVFRGAGIEFEGVREYAEGDDPRTVDWNVTARVGRPYVRTYVDDRDLTVLFVLDLSASMDAGLGAWSARRTAARFCGTLALAAARNRDRAGLIAFSGGVDRWVPPKKGVGHVLRIVRDCLALPAGSRETGLAPALEFAARVARRRSVVFVVSDFLAEGWETALGLCARRHDVIAVRLLSPELTPARAGLVRVTDPETGTSSLVDLGSATVREAYRARIARWKARTEDAFRRARVDRLDVPIPVHPTRDAIARPILQFFRMREERGAKR